MSRWCGACYLHPIAGGLKPSLTLHEGRNTLHHHDITLNVRSMVFNQILESVRMAEIYGTRASYSFIFTVVLLEIQCQFKPVR